MLLCDQQIFRQIKIEVDHNDIAKLKLFMHIFEELTGSFTRLRKGTTKLFTETSKEIIPMKTEQKKCYFCLIFIFIF